MQNKDDWNIDGGRLFRLDEKGNKLHEIHVVLAHGSHFNDQLFAAASELLVMMCEPNRPLERSEAEAIRRLALELETTGRIASLEGGEAKQAAIIRNREVQCALCDLLDSLASTKGVWACRKQKL